MAGSDLKLEAPPIVNGNSSEFRVRTSTYVLSALTLALLCLIVVEVGTIDIYVAGLCALAGDLYVLRLAGSKNIVREQGKIEGIAPLFLVTIVPLLTSTILASLGYLGSPIESILRISMATGFSIAMFISSFPIPLAIKFKIKESRRKDNLTYRPLVSILVPAYNEQEVISRTLESLMNLKYENKEIIVIDDGSTDLTGVVASWYKQHGVKVLSKPNGGKASALNYGLLFARGEIVITIDSDSMVARDAINEVVHLMENQNVVAVAGNIRVLNSKSLLTRIQELEYIMAINMLRRAFALFGTVMVVPGAFGAFRKKDVVEVGGYDRDTLTEDFDLTIKLLKTRGIVDSSSLGMAYTEVPATWKVLYKQRLRWSTGTFQTINKHRNALWNRRFGLLHAFVFPLLLLSVFNPITSYVALGSGIALALTGHLLLFVKMELLFLMVQVLVALVSLSLDNEKYGLAIYSPFFVLIYKQFIDFTTVVSAIRALRKSRKEWHKIDRTGGMQAIKVTSRSK
ncbi:MAG: glycosyltransferase [Nitrososphaerota archaeon]|nr:glycosyltransferase [Nitrososphaerota archaeon]